MSCSSSISMEIADKETSQDNVEQVELLSGVYDHYDGVIVEMKEAMDPKEFGSLLRASLSQWKQLGKRGIWIKLPIELANLIEVVVKEGFDFHHAECNYLMLVRWIAETTNSLPANASHRVGIGAFVMNSNRELLVVQELSGIFRGSGVWKLPTGVVNEGEDICEAAIRELKEETGVSNNKQAVLYIYFKKSNVYQFHLNSFQVDAEFVEVLAFRQSHASYFTKSDLFFVCMLRPCSFDIQKQASEIEAAKWMPIEEYADQPFVKENSGFDYVAKICLARANDSYTGFSAKPAYSASGKRTYIYSKLEI
ncbi:nudix hydrolase 7-like isoform X1 [Cucurbita maxima]|uniref:Nudix hydrolase 7-like isoform X1 n=1 Tax=Cucurbita maxima TaxID=3661 RepID=A0A6J1HX15_CUCMA|nr:nudix hydrolase 7-like isoform X1 [Cucurbita maxima]XP_022969182.1 nudix hydrolase 7-like isoform X1 [Cucurbita maxima]